MNLVLNWDFSAGTAAFLISRLSVEDYSLLSNDFDRLADLLSSGLVSLRWGWRWCHDGIGISSNFLSPWLDAWWRILIFDAISLLI